MPRLHWEGEAPAEPPFAVAYDDALRAAGMARIRSSGTGGGSTVVAACLAGRTVSSDPNGEMSVEPWMPRDAGRLHG